MRGAVEMDWMCFACEDINFEGQEQKVTDWIFVPPQVHMLRLHLQCDGIWRCSPWERIMFKWDHESGAPIMRLVSLEERQELSLFSMCRHNKKKAGQEECPHQAPNLSAHWTWTSEAPKLWEINVFCLSHYNTLLKQPELSKTLCFSVLAFWAFEISLSGTWQQGRVLEKDNLFRYYLTFERGKKK